MRYRDLYDAFRWELPSHFNFAIDVVDRWAAERDGPALIWENAAGGQARYSYSDIARLSRRFAAVLRAHGVAKGDRVLIMLPRLPHWQITMVGALRIGAVPIPCIEMLTARDLAYRLTHAGARAIVCAAPRRPASSTASRATSRPGSRSAARRAGSTGMRPWRRHRHWKKRCGSRPRIRPSCTTPEARPVSPRVFCTARGRLAAGPPSRPSLRSGSAPRAVRTARWAGCSSRAC